MIDLESLKNNKTVVHCRTEEQALEFLAEMRNQYPEATRRWGEGRTEWNWYRELTCYWPIFEGGTLGSRVEYCFRDFFVDEGFTIIPFEGLYVVPDLGEFEASRIGLLDL